jgi:putative intracellular protease/amidase
MTDPAPGDAGRFSKKPCALLWDESFLWGVMAWRSLGEAGLPFDLLRAGDIREGALSRYGMLFVPGGWASNKIEALGEKGREEIRRFVAAGGSYLGICGGAGLATPSGLDLLPVRRKPSSERVPSFSGPILLALEGHRIWRDVQTPVFSAWWPSQFQIADPDLQVLARYGEPQADAFSSDIPVAQGAAIGWSALEQRYGILLDPARLSGEPAVIAGRFGRGRVVLSLVHFDTPADVSGAIVLRNLWPYLSSGGSACPQTGPARAAGRSGPDLSQAVRELAGEIQRAVAELIETGVKNSLWRWRNPLLLHWRRGVRGLEYSTLAVMVAEIGKQLDAVCVGEQTCRSASLDSTGLERELTAILRQMVPFIAKAKRLVVREGFYMQTAPLSPLVCDDEEIRRLRQELFAATMSHGGGDFKCLIDAVDGLLYKLIC